ncbi:MAG: UDP-N-acetylmuramoyl-tripeptide--D-alanyl-D-alanine ligase [Paludibacteraceae bacterium]|nr:UDP-N-acetylmuramoyl-tripeptide--D-alanyl-D-alanine ligase [Paludibacteraceae bacterium]
MNWDFLIQNKDSLLVSTDTRNLPVGCVFFALHGERFDGNKFAKQALEQGASLVVIDDPEVFATHSQSPIAHSQSPIAHSRLLLVEDTLLALQDLARAWRRELGLPIIGITGTNGKTTTKELLATVLSTKYHLHYTQGNLNNQIGVPLTLLQITRAHELAIVEMGASHPGDIKELVDIAEPNYGLITNVGRAHLEGFGSFEGVQRTKQELYDYLVAHDGTIFRNTDNPYLATMYQNALQAAGDLQRSDLQDQGSDLQRSDLHYTTGVMPDGTRLIGAYNAENVSAAICVGEHFGVDREQALAAIRAYVPTNNRSQAMQTAHNQLIVDAYNANPTSMQAAISVFKGETFILGAMRELGDYTHLEHQNVVNMLAERKAEMVYLVGEEYRLTTSPYPIFDTVEELREHLIANPLRDKYILLKGSRSTKMEKLLEVL